MNNSALSDEDAYQRWVRVAALFVLLLALGGCARPGDEPCRTITSAALGALLPPVNPVGAAIGGVIGHETTLYLGPSLLCD